MVTGIAASIPRTIPAGIDNRGLHESGTSLQVRSAAATPAATFVKMSPRTKNGRVSIVGRMVTG